MRVCAMRALTAREREQVQWAKKTPYVSKIEAYKDLVREMEPDTAYALSLNGTTRRSIRVMLTKAAKALDIELRWAPYKAGATEVFVELK